MDAIPVWIQKGAFRLASSVESAAFRLSRLVSLPAWIRFTLARPDDRNLGYGQLLELNSQHAPIPKPSVEARQRQQLKWAQRVAHLAKLYSLDNILEVGCGSGLASYHLQKLGFKVSAVDIQDQLTPAASDSPMQLTIGDVCGRLPFPSNQFGLVFSVNAFEHFAQVDSAMDEMLRVTESGGLIYLSFAPLFFSPRGLHASRRLGMPYPQILFSEETLQRFVDERMEEITDSYDESSDITKIGPYVNGLSLNKYRDLFGSRQRRFRRLCYVERTSYEGLTMIIEHAGLFKARAPSFEDLILAGIKLIAIKR